jgi:hypothetical protein
MVRVFAKIGTHSLTIIEVKGKPCASEEELDAVFDINEGDRLEVRKAGSEEKWMNVIVDGIGQLSPGAYLVFLTKI